MCSPQFVSSSRSGSITLAVDISGRGPLRAILEGSVLSDGFIGEGRLASVPPTKPILTRSLLLQEQSWVMVPIVLFALFNASARRLTTRAILDTFSEKFTAQRRSSSLQVFPRIR